MDTNATPASASELATAPKSAVVAMMDAAEADGLYELPEFPMESTR